MDPIVVAALISVVGVLVSGVLTALVKFTIEARKARNEAAHAHAKVAAALKTLKRESKAARKNLDNARAQQATFGAVASDTNQRVQANEQRVAVERPMWQADRKLFNDHIEADAVFQGKLEPLIPALIKLAEEAGQSTP